MKKVFILAVFMFLMPFWCHADFDITKWQYYKDINDSHEGLVSFVVDDELFSGSEGDLSDVRIIDDQNNEIAYKIITSQARSEKKTYQPKLLNNSYKKEEGSLVILDFGENNQGVNRLHINTGVENFKANATLFGSNDMSDWGIIKEDLYIYDYFDQRGNFHSQDTDIIFPESIFRYIKLIVNEEQGQRINIDSVTGFKYETENAREMIRRPSFKLSEDEDLKTTEVIIDIGQSGLPVNKLQLTVSDKNFNRKVFVYSSNDGNSWKYIGNSYIFRYDTPKYSGENLMLKFNETKSRYLKAEIRNLDDAQLNIEAIHTFSIYREIAFQANVNNTYKVYFGKKYADSPEYDLDKYFRYLDLDNIKTVTPSFRTNNMKFVSFEEWKEEGLKEQKKEVIKEEPVQHLLSGALIISAFLLAFLLWRFFRK